jgi:hypothetical protein
LTAAYVSASTALTTPAEVNDGVDTGEGIGKRTGLERRANDRRARRISAPGTGLTIARTVTPRPMRLAVDAGR